MVTFPCKQLLQRLEIVNGSGTYVRWGLGQVVKYLRIPVLQA